MHSHAERGNDDENVHFKNEEIIAEAVNFPFNQNKLEHRHLLEEMRDMREELEADNEIWSDEQVKKYSRFLGNWMIDHIVKEDMKLKPVLETYPYDFKPDL